MDLEYPHNLGLVRGRLLAQRVLTGLPRSRGKIDLDQLALDYPAGATPGVGPGASLNAGSIDRSTAISGQSRGAGKK